MKTEIKGTLEEEDLEGLPDGCRVRIRRLGIKGRGPLVAQGVLVGDLILGEPLVVALCDRGDAFTTSRVVAIWRTSAKHFFAETENSLYGCEVLRTSGARYSSTETSHPYRSNSPLH